MDFSPWLCYSPTCLLCPSETPGKLSSQSLGTWFPLSIVLVPLFPLDFLLHCLELFIQKTLQWSPLWLHMWNTQRLPCTNYATHFLIFHCDFIFGGSYLHIPYIRLLLQCLSLPDRMEAPGRRNLYYLINCCVCGAWKIACGRHLPNVYRINEGRQEGEKGQCSLR